MRIFERGWGWASWQNLTDEGRKGKPKTWPFHGRAWLHLNKGAVASFNFSWLLWSRFCGFHFNVRPDGEGSFAFMVAFPPFAFWFSVDARGWLLRLANKIVALQPSDMGERVTWSGRELSVMVHDWAVWWKLWVCDYGWTRSRPRWRDGCFHLLGHNRRQGEPELIEEAEANVMMPERNYKATVTLRRVRFGWDRLPRCFDKETTQAEVKMHDGEQIPVPGKGTTSYNCGEDACYGWSGGASSVDDATWKVSLSVLEDRKRNPR